MFRELITLRFISLLAIFLLRPTLSSNISPDSKRLYHDIVSGHGLYYGFTKLTELGSSNFKDIVFNTESNKLWLVEFYNSWCGHCHRFAPTWKALASDVFEWRTIVGIGAVDCANDANNQLCRDMEIMYYPMIKLFPPHSDEKYLGEEFQKGTVEEMRQNLITKLKDYQNSHNNVMSVNLKPVTETILESLWEGMPSEVLYLSFILDSEDSLVGAEVILDLCRTKELKIRSVYPSNHQLSNHLHVKQESDAVVIMGRDLQLTTLTVDKYTRTDLNKVIRQFLVEHGINVSMKLPNDEVPVNPEVNIGDVMNIMQIEDEVKKKLNKEFLDLVFQLDLEGAMRYSLKNEVPLHRNITGAHLTALNNYLSVLIKYFPFGQQGVQFLKELKEKTIDGKNEVSGKSFRQIFLQLEDEYKPFLPGQGWMGCRGSQPEYRGYPCSLWTLFHTLTVHEELRDKNTTDDKPDVIHAMAGYVKNFFSCSHCAEHFSEMAKTIDGNVTTQGDSIMWLWAAHNNVNSRLAGDQTEDPKHKKIQFPSSEACPSCHADDGLWNKSEVMIFMKKMYSNIVYIQEDDLKSTSTTTASPSIGPRYDRSLRHKVFGNEQIYKHQGIDDGTNRSAWDFNGFDISLCVVLYICSVTILILVCIKFVFKRSYRKKTYVHDILNKV